MREIAASRLPAIFQGVNFAAAGGMLSFGPLLLTRFNNVAEYIECILKGAKAGEIPIEQEMRYELVVNLQTARALGIKIPHSILVRADKVIE